MPNLVSSPTAHLLFLKSALSPSGSFMSTEAVSSWLAEQNKKVQISVNPCPLGDIRGWNFNKTEGRIQHESGHFFSIDGIEVEMIDSVRRTWHQPIINQPEVGYLGIITKEFNGVLHFLLQAKVEPGNIWNTQLSPTLQATRSNYIKVHKGQLPLFLDYFRCAKPNQILLDQLQSEQGSRFLRKRNRNIIIKIEDDIEVPPEFVWLTLAQIKILLRNSNQVNMDTRSVISGICFGGDRAEAIELINFLVDDKALGLSRKAFLKSALLRKGGLNSTEEIISLLVNLRSHYQLTVRPIPLSALKNWTFGEYEICHELGLYFKVIGVDVEISTREVCSWAQPMIQPAQEGLCALVCKEINGIVHFAMQAKMECGNRDIVEFAPTVQCLIGNYRQTAPDRLPFLDYVMTAVPQRVIYDTMQSEEGGRFFREQNRNLIILAGDEISEDLPPHFIWMTLNQLQNLLCHSNYVNIQARSLIAAISFV